MVDSQKDRKTDMIGGGVERQIGRQAYVLIDVEIELQTRQTDRREARNADSSQADRRRDVDRETNREPGRQTWHHMHSNA